MSRSMKQRASNRIWDIIATRAVAKAPPVKSPSPKKEYITKVYQTSTERKEAKESGGIPTQHLSADERRTRSRILQWRRQHGG